MALWKYKQKWDGIRKKLEENKKRKNERKEQGEEELKSDRNKVSELFYHIKENEGLIKETADVAGKEYLINEKRVLQKNLYELLASSKKLRKFYRQLIKLESGTTEAETVKIVNTNTSWILLGITFLLSIVSFLTGHKDTGYLSLAMLFLWISISFQEIEEPKVGFLWRKGVLKGMLLSGWYLGFPFILDIEIRTTAKQDIFFQEEMYTKVKKRIVVRGRFYYRLVNPKKAITISEESMRERIEVVGLSKLKGEIGSRDFQGLLDDKGGVEDCIILGINRDIKEEGYEVIGAEIDDFKEEIESRAAEIREIGEAEAYVQEAKARAVANVVLNNYPAAIVMGLNSIKDGIVEAIKPRKSEESKSRKVKTEKEIGLELGGKND
ncbi:SPFH domain-containing protein [Patescibacteria group bacterium]|nr:SPFH domain-containing protein [Patescibacteria group bacterium]